MNGIKQIHAHGLCIGALSFTRAQPLKILVQKLLNLQMPNLPYARSLLNSILLAPTANAHTKTNATLLFNKLLQAYSRLGPFPQCILLYSHQLLPFSPTTHTFTSLFSACASFRRPLHGRALHAHFLLLFPSCPDPFATTSLADMYSKCGLLDDAHQVFDEIPHKDVPLWNSLISGYAKSGNLAKAEEMFDRMPARNVVSWTTMVSGYAQNGMHEEAVEAFSRMWSRGEVRPNAVTLASVLPACGSVGALRLGERIEGYARREGLMGNAFVGNALVEMYARCGSIGDARRVFDEMGGRRNLCSWNSMIGGLAVHGRCKEALQLFNELKVSFSYPCDMCFETLKRNIVAHQQSSSMHVVFGI